MENRNYKFSNYTIEVLYNPAINMCSSLQDKLVKECTLLAKNSFRNPNISMEDIRSHIIDTSTSLFVRDSLNRMVGFASSSLKRIENYYIIYLQGGVISEEYKGKGLHNPLIPIRIIEEIKKINTDTRKIDVLIGGRTQNPIVYKTMNRKLGLFPNPDGSIDRKIKNIIMKFAKYLYNSHSNIQYKYKFLFDSDKSIIRKSYKSIYDIKEFGSDIYLSNIPFCIDDHEINNYMKKNLDWKNGDALIMLGYYDEEKVNRMFEEVQQRMGFCGIEEAELDLYHAVSV